MSEQTKRELRERVLTLLRSQEEEKRYKKSLAIKDKLFALTAFKKAETILFYASFDGEVDTFDMILEATQLGKQIGLPTVQKEKQEMIPVKLNQGLDTLQEGPYGIKAPDAAERELLSESSIDLVVVPGVAFDKANNRLGRGGGYYDRFLGRLSEDIPTIGLAFDFQMVDYIPQLQDHDKTVSQVLHN